MASFRRRNDVIITPYVHWEHALYAKMITSLRMVNVSAAEDKLQWINNENYDFLVKQLHDMGNSEYFYVVDLLNPIVN